MYQSCSGGITAALGFQATGIHCGVKKAKKDLSLVYSLQPAHAAGMFTTNKVQAAPILVNKQQLAHSPSVRALLVNSGNANACTGEKGLEDAWTMVRTTASLLQIPNNEVLISSTGVIGQYLPIKRITTGIAMAVPHLSESGHTDAAEAIMTTDTFVKEYAVKTQIDGKDVTVGGMAKGSGMIAPNMATMLAFITTDAAIAPSVLQHALRQSVERTFNRISVDGDTSTNDMVVILANGMAGNKQIETVNDPGYDALNTATEQVLRELSKMIVLDGEGATKLVEVKVVGADTQEMAVSAARSICNSNLVKTAIHGEDANWGRILAAVGYSGIDFNPAHVEIFFDDVPILRKNYSINFSEAEAKRVLSKKELTITVRLNGGGEEATFWTCDLSKEYIAINANYRT